MKSMGLLGLCPIVFCAVLASCAAKSPAPVTPAPASSVGAISATKEPFDLQKMLARESPSPLAPAPVAGFAGEIKGTIPSVGKPTVEETQDGAGKPLLKVLSGIGSKDQMTCFLTPESRDPGSWTLAAAAKLENGRQQPPEVQVKMAGRWAVLFTTLTQFIGPEGNASIGRVKVAVAVRVGGSILCLQDDLGYAKSFEEAVTGLVKSSAFAKELPIRRVEARELSVDSTVIGMQIDEAADSPDGSKEVRFSVFGGVFSGATTGWTSIDGADTEILNAQGDLLSSSSVFAINDKAVHTLDLQRVGKSDYSLKGTSHGQPIEDVISVAQPLASSPQVSAARRAALKVGNAQWFALDTDPSPPKGTAVTSTKRGDHVLAEVKGKEESRCTVTDEGDCERRETDTAMGHLSDRRIAADGARTRKR